MIKVESLSKNFGSHQVLKDIRLQFDRGNVYGIVGENGAGKTTLFRCIAGLESFSGNISSELKPLKNHLGFLPTDPNFFPRMTGEEYLQLVCNARKVKYENSKEKNLFDLPLQQFAETYSTGMKKKLALTALLLTGNNYFLFDEPFNGVDIHSNMMITEIILRLKSLGKIIIISSHIFSTLNETCDTIFLLREGTIANTVGKASFAQLEAEMKRYSVGDKVEKFGLR
ncbi:MAG: ATP-binding cassette domain-containing protein [Bacteroidia bacterium]